MNEYLLNVYRLVENNPCKKNLFHFFWLGNGMLTATEKHRLTTQRKKRRWSLIENMREKPQPVENSK